VILVGRAILNVLEFPGMNSEDFAVGGVMPTLNGSRTRMLELKYIELLERRIAALESLITKDDVS